TRGSKTLGTVRVFLNVGSGAKGGTSPGVAAPNTLTFSAPPMTTPSGPPQTVTINADGYYATVTRTGGFPAFGSNELLSLTPGVGRLMVKAPSLIWTDVDYETVYIETAGGTEAVRVTLREVFGTLLTVDPPTINLNYASGGRAPSPSFTVSA